jgi:hypothetical protein
LKNFHNRNIRKFDKIIIIEIFIPIQLPIVSNSSITIEKIEAINTIKEPSQSRFHAQLMAANAGQVMDIERILSPNYLKSRLLIINNYESYCSKIPDCFPWPLGKYFICYLRWLDAYGFSHNTVTTYCTVLKSHCLKEKQLKITDLKERLISKTLKYIKSNPTNRDVGQEAEPCTLTDVKYLIEGMPKKYEHLEKMASLFLFAICTGARGSTCMSVQLKDLLTFTQFDESSLLVMNVGTMKGFINKAHQVTFEDNKNLTRSINFIYYLRLHLLKQFKLDLNNLKYWKLSKEMREFFIWTNKLSTKYDMSINIKSDYNLFDQYLKEIAYFTGFTKSFFSTHSFRVGFITSAFKRGLGNNVESVFQSTGRIAQWVPNGSAQMGYIKKALQRSILCNKVVLGDQNVFMSNATMDPVIFHELEGPLQNRWPEETNFKSLRSHVNRQTFFKRKLNAYWISQRYKFWNPLNPFSYLTKWMIHLDSQNIDTGRMSEKNYLIHLLNNYDDVNYEDKYEEIQKLFVNFAEGHIQGRIKYCITHNVTAINDPIVKLKNDDDDEDSETHVGDIKLKLHSAKIDSLQPIDNDADNVDSDTIGVNEVIDEEYDDYNDFLARLDAFKDVEDITENILDEDYNPNNENITFESSLNHAARKTVENILRLNKEYIKTEWLENDFSTKNLRADTMYRQWCKEVNISDPYPLDENFIKFIACLNHGDGKNKKYAFETICKYVQDIKNTNLNETSFNTDAKVSKLIRYSLNTLKKIETSRGNTVSGMIPITYEDLEFLF